MRGTDGGHAVGVIDYVPNQGTPFFGKAGWAILNSERWLCVFFICALLMPPLPFPAGNSGIHVAPVFALIALLPGIGRMTELRDRRHGSLPLLFILFLAVLTGSVVCAEVYSGWKIALGSLTRVLLFAIAVWVFLDKFIGPRENEPDSLTFARFLFTVGLLGAIFACLDFYFQWHVPARFALQLVWLKHGVVRRAQGVFYEASTLGNFCAFFLVMILAASFPADRKRVWPRRILIPGALVFSAALIFSSSRASVVTVLVAGCAFVCIRRANILRVLVPACALLTTVGAAVRYALPAFSANYWSRIVASIRYGWSSPNGVLSGRITHWKVLLDFLTKHPWHLLFGIGYKTLPYTSLLGAPVVADNTYLSLLVETGIVGLAVFAFLNMAILRTAWRAARSLRPRAAFFGVWIFCFWCGQMVQMLSGDLITYWRVLPVYFWVLAAAARESRA